MTLVLWLLAAGLVLNALAMRSICRDSARRDRHMRVLVDDVDLDATIFDSHVADIERRLDAIERRQRCDVYSCN
jgi:hypothetical protein